MSKQLLIRIALPILILAISVLIMKVLMHSGKPPQTETPLRPPLLVEVQTVNQTSAQYQIKSQGVVEPLQQTVLTTEVSGKVVALSDAFVEGAFVKKNEVLVYIDDTDYKTELLTAEAQLAQALADLDQEVARGKVAEEEWKTVSELATPLALREPQLKKEQANVKAAQAKLAKAKRNLERTKILAPFDAVVTSRMVDVGQFVGNSTQLGEVYGTSTAELRLPISQHDALFIDNTDTTNPVTLTYKVGLEMMQWQGYLHRTEALIDPQSRMFYVVARVDDPYALTEKSRSILHFGRFVSANIQGVEANNLIIIPRNLMIGKDQVLTIENNALQIKTVTVVRSDDEFAYISAGLNSGDLICLTNVASPINGLPVRIKGQN